MESKERIVQEIWTPNSARMSYFSAPVTNKRPSATVTLVDLFGKITGTNYKERTCALRTLFNKKDIYEFKTKHFDYVCFSGTFSYGSDASLEEHSQLLCLDFDDYDDVQALRQILLGDPYFETLLLFTSPSGRGVKWVIHIDTTLRDHREWFKLLEQYMADTYHLTVDPKCINVSRGCYLPYDPEAYIAPALLDADQGAVDSDEVKAIAEALIAQGIDITEGYDNWLRLGFALADGLGAEGRDLFHRLSQQNAAYDERTCEQQWQHCLNGKGEGVTIRSFFKMAQDAGLSLTERFRKFPPFRHVAENAGNIEKRGLIGFLEDYASNGGMAEAAEMAETDEEGFSHTFTDHLDLATLPPLLRDAMEPFTKPEDRDKMLLGALTTFAGAMPGVFGVYDRRRVYPPYYLLIDAPAASDKGHLSACRQLLMPIEDEIQEQNRREREAYQEEQEGEEPVYRSLFIAANSSSTATYEDLSANGGWGLTLETEADTMTGAMKSDYGDYSSGLRAAFHHEPITYSRRKDKEHVNIPVPRWSVLLTCTPRQVPALLPSCENGLASRFVFYNMSRHLFWRDVFEDSGETIDEKYLKIGQRYLPLYHALDKLQNKPLQFVLSDAQKKQFNTYFESMQLEQVHIYGDDLIAFVRRLGLVCFRVAMTLTVLRRADQEPLLDPLSQVLVCSEEDFQTAMTIIDCLVNHTIHVYTHLIAHDAPQVSRTIVKLSEKERALYHALGDTFSTKDYRDAAISLKISVRTAERYVGDFCQKH